MKNYIEEERSEIKETEPEDLNRRFEYEELIRAYNYVKEKSAPGLDQIEYGMIKWLSEGLKREILNLFNYCYWKGVQFNEWKKSNDLHR